MIDIYRLINGVETLVAQVSNKNAAHHRALMGADEISISVTTEEALDVKDGDYIYFNGLKYTQNRDVEDDIYSEVNYQNNFIFEHPFYKLLDKLFTYKLTGIPVFTLTGKLSDFVDMIAWNMNYHVTDNPLGVDSGWLRGSVVETDYMNLTFSSISCRDALTQIATAFNAEFYFSSDGKTINFVDRIENETELVFEQGMGKGLYHVSRQNVDEKDTITRVYPVGGNKNVPNANADAEGYLKLPELYLQNTAEYSRIVEKRVVFEDIFPHFLGTIDSVSGTDNVEMVCNAIDFDLNQIAVGDNARINFLTGSLMGVSFQFQFDYASKKVTLIPQNDDTALSNDDGTKPQVPRALKKAVAGDKFNFTGIIMPAAYVNTAITKLRDKATAWLSFYSRKRMKFGLDIDHRWMRGKQELQPGDLVTVKIPQKSISKIIRITDITKDLYDGKLSATVSNYLDENWEKKVEGAISSLQTTVSGGTYGAGVDILQRYDERPSSDRNVMSSLRSEKNFLRKDAVDTAAEYIHFKKGMDALDFVQDKFVGSGAGIYKDEQGNSVMEVDKLSVRKEAWFNEIIINQIRFQGGIVVYSAATMEVISVVDGGSYIQANFDTKNGQVTNQFAVDDQIRCQRFSGGSVIKYYMSRVTSVGTDYIRLSKSDIDGTLNVQVGDQLVQFGNRTNTARQSLIEVNVLDGGKQTFYQGVNSYNLTNKNYLELGRVLVDGTWRNMIRSFGGAYLGNRDLSSYIQYNETTGRIEIKADVQFRSTSGAYKSVETAIGEVQVGGRNLLLTTNSDYSKWFNLEQWTVENKCIKAVNTSSGAQSNYYDTSVNKTFTISFNVIQMSGVFRMHNNNFDIQIPSVVGKFVHTFTVPADVLTDHIVIYGTGSGTAIINDIKLEVGNKATDWTPAPEDVQSQIDTSNAILADIASDNKLTPNEKQQLKREWDKIYIEYPIISAQGQDIIGGSDDYDDAYSVLMGYILPLLSDLTATSPIPGSGSELRTRFNLYYLRREQIINNIQSTIDAQSKAADYLRLALTGSTEISGGLVGTNVILLKTLAGIISGGMSGLASDPVGFWTGGTYAQAVADAAKAFKSAMNTGALDKKDGSGHRAKGNLAWNTAGDVFVRGLLEVLSGGKIGNFNIVDGSIVGYGNDGIERYRVNTDSIPDVSGLSSGWTSVGGDLNGDLNGSGSNWEGTGTTFNNNILVTETSITLPYSTRIQVDPGQFGYTYLSNENYVTNIQVYQTVYVINSSGSTVYSGASAGQYITLPAGTFTVRLITVITFDANVGYGVEFTLSTGDNRGIVFEETIQKTAFGLNGFYSYFSNSEYIHFKNGKGTSIRGKCDIPAGLGGASINGSGGVFANWGKITATNQIVKSGSNYTITHNIGDTNYSIILTPISTNAAYFSSKNANTIVVTCSSGFDFVLIRTV